MSTATPHEPMLCFAGKTTVRSNGREDKMVGSPNRTLLAVLALRAGQPCAADRLIDWVWGEKIPANPKGALYTRVSRLREALASARGLVVSADDGYMLDVASEDIDLYAVESALTADDRTIESMLAADQLWRGRPFADVASVDVIEDEAARLTQMWLVARHEMIERLIEAERLEEAYSYCDSTLREEPFDEPTVALLLRLAGMGRRRREIVSRFDEWRRRYIAAFETSPPAYLGDLANQIRPGDGADRGASLDAIFDLASNSTLFGQHVDEIVHSDQQITVVTGPVGIGKTVLAAHWRGVRRDAGNGVDVVQGANLAERIESGLSLNGHDIIIEDLHNYEGGLQLNRVIAALAAVPAVFITSRPLGAHEPAFEIVAELGKFQRAAVWQPSLLGLDDIETMVEALDPDHVDHVAAETIARQVLQITGGLPAASDLVLRSALRHHRKIASHQLIGSATAQAMVEYLGSEYQRLSPTAQQVVALLSVTLSEVTGQEIDALLNELRDSLDLEPVESAEITSLLLEAHGAGLVAPTPPDHYESIGNAATWVVRQFDPQMLAVARDLMHRRAIERDDVVDQAFQLLLSHETPSGELANRCLEALRRLLRSGQHEDVVDFSNQSLRDPRLSRASDLDVCRDVASIHLVAARAAESIGWRSVADHHWDRAFELGVQCSSDEAVAEAASAAGRFGRSAEDSPSGRRVAAAREWAERHGSVDTRVLLEIEDLRRIGALGRHIPDDRLHQLRTSLDRTSPLVRADGWAAIAAALLALPMAKVQDELDAALSRVADCLADVDDDPTRRPVAELAFHTLRAARALRLADAEKAADLIERGHGASLYRRHPRRTWLAMAQKATLAAINEDLDGWRDAVEAAVLFGCGHHFADAGAVGAAHLAYATRQQLDPPEFEGPVQELIEQPSKIDLGDARPHPATRLGLMSLMPAKANRAAFDKAWSDLHPERPNLLTSAGLVYAAWAAQGLKATDCYGDIAAQLTSYAGEFAVLPVGVAPIAKVDEVLAGFS